MHRVIHHALLLLVAILLTDACGHNNTSTTPTPTTPNTITDTFSGTLTPNGAATHPFAVPSAGAVTATLTNVTPDSTIVVGFSLGTWNGSACQIVLANDKAVQGTAVVGNVSGPGNLCVRVYDVGNLVNPESYQITVVHP